MLYIIDGPSISIDCKERPIHLFRLLLRIDPDGIISTCLDLVILPPDERRTTYLQQLRFRRPHDGGLLRLLHRHEILPRREVSVSEQALGVEV